MNITILNGNPDPDNQKFDAYLDDLIKSLESSDNNIVHFKLRDMKIRHCRGCFGCWLKTPGQCIFKDDSHDICKEVINSDFVLYAAPLVMGFPSAVLKIAMDKLIPLLLPYIELVDNKECHHMRRYDKEYPPIGLIIEKEDDTESEDIEIVRDIFARAALDFKSSCLFIKQIDVPVQEVSDAINNI
ncbi:MAG: flavodoxin family protein [Deltaproteobacteria bacterium]|nr:flavodoxin family protein [Deltaproteobacteria bacterium]